MTHHVPIPRTDPQDRCPNAIRRPVIYNGDALFFSYFFLFLHTYIHSRVQQWYTATHPRPPFHSLRFN